jgi:hypothetical protein
LTEQPEKMIELLKLLKNTLDDEIDCDEFWTRAAWLTEVEVALSLDELKKYLHHLQLCPGCAEDFELLKSVVSDQDSYST